MYFRRSGKISYIVSTFKEVMEKDFCLFSSSGYATALDVGSEKRCGYEFGSCQQMSEFKS